MLLLPVRWKAALEAKYKEELDDAFGIQFNNLFTITNMPIKVYWKKFAFPTAWSALSRLADQIA